MPARVFGPLLSAWVGHRYGLGAGLAALATKLGGKVPAAFTELCARLKALATADSYQQFDAAFWSDRLGFYALALDGDKRRCEVAATVAMAGDRRRCMNSPRVWVPGTAFSRSSTMRCRTMAS